MMQSAACNALHSIEQRCCRWLLAAHDRAGDHSFHLTQQALAEMLGVQRTTVTAVSSKLQARGPIAYHRGAVEVLDRPGIEKAACECYAAVEGHLPACCRT
ncbi:helix-turn-helix domain-containing protein [Phenylobacterium sp.]|jgi:CRP-like cAMP-binding protein|uniref:Crp/Fnr family transcriptional regulator n=1 Tax=Phenylobacterium sp. TaxID=1871053 RepID=UPI002F41694B